MTSRNKREGHYAGFHNGKHCRVHFDKLAAAYQVLLERIRDTTDNPWDTLIDISKPITADEVLRKIENTRFDATVQNYIAGSNIDFSQQITAEEALKEYGDQS